jgi:predicted dithiol-disulfide oxidoreductase (DUF899 family)
VRLSAEFKDASEQYSDPTTVECFVRAPDDTLYAYTYALGQIVKDDVGRYHYDFDTSIADNETQTGTWHYRFEGEGLIQAADETAFILRYSAVIA